MKMYFGIITCLFASALLASAENVKHKVPFNFDHLASVKRLSELTTYRKENKLAVVVKSYDMDKASWDKKLWLIQKSDSLSDKTGSISWTSSVTASLPLNTSGKISSPQFSDDGQFIYYLDASVEPTQVWRIAAKEGAQAEKITDLPLEVMGFKLFPGAKRILVALDVYPKATTLAQTKEWDDEIAKRKSNYKVYDSLLFRHWDTWEDGKRSHLFVWENGKEPKDLMKNMDVDAPTHPFGGMEEVAIHPGGNDVVFVARADQGSAASWTHNLDLYSVNVKNGKRTNLTLSNKAVDSVPAFSNSGDKLAYLSMARAGYESDQYKIKILDWKTKKIRTVAENWDYSPSSLVWRSDDKAILTDAQDHGQNLIYEVDLITDATSRVTDQGNASSPQYSFNQIVFLKDDLKSPAEVFSVSMPVSTPYKTKQITEFNKALLANIEFGDYEQFSFEGAKGDKVYGYVVKPVTSLIKGKKVPVAFLIHGGPQGSFSNHFHYRWNPEIYAGAGYAVVMIDFHGSTGYGQAFTDSIRGHWHDYPYEDLMKGLDFAIQKYSFLDGNKVAALGASYGGYMINWINGHTDRFKALVCHDGNIDERFAYYATDELWFPEWDHEGHPAEKEENYKKASPIEYVKNWKTPTLVIHGGNDYRITDSQGMATFTALQRKGVASRFLYFPTENHWVLNPQNSKVWHQEVLAWLATYLK